MALIEQESFDNEEEQFNEIQEEDKTQQIEAEQPSEPQEDNLPSKYKNKSVEDIIKMHQEAES